MTYKLYKLSSPGWVKDFETENQMKSELYKHICKICREDSEWMHEESRVRFPINEASAVDEMLATACGCEFDVEHVE